MEEAIIKFNGGALALLCTSCRVIIKTGKDFNAKEKLYAKGEGHLEPQYCKDCSQHIKDTQFVSYEVAKLAAQYGYNNPSIAYYMEGSDKLFKTWNKHQYEYVSVTNGSFLYKAPTHLELAAWISENYNVVVHYSPTMEYPIRFEGRIMWQAKPYTDPQGKIQPGLYLHWLCGKSEGINYRADRFDSIHEAFNAAFKLAFNQIKHNNNES